MNITYYKRKRAKTGHFSIERVFDDVKSFLNPKYTIKYKESYFHSKGIFRRVFNILEAPFFQGEINHINGDIHFISFFLKKKITIVTMCDTVILKNSKGFKHFILFYIWFWIPYRRAAILTTISESAKSELISILNCPKDKIVVIHCPLSPIFKKPINKVFNNKPILLQIGVTDNKNIPRVVSSLTGIYCHLRIIGLLNLEQLNMLNASGIEYSYAYNLSNEEIAMEYQKSDILIFTSTYEGFGLPIIEAQASGTPVISSNIHATKEVAGELSACLVDPYNIEEIRFSVVKIINDKVYRDNLIINGFENIKRFHLNAISEQYSDLYKKIYNSSH